MAAEVVANEKGKAQTLAQKVLRTVARGSQGPSAPATPDASGECEKGQLKSNADKTYQGRYVFCTALGFGLFHTTFFLLCYFFLPGVLELATWPAGWWPMFILVNASNHFWFHMLTEVARVKRTETSFIFSNFFCKVWEVDTASIESMSVQKHWFRGDHVFIVFTPKYLKEQAARRFRKWCPCIPSKNYAFYLQDPATFVNEYIASKKVSKE